MPTPGCWPRCTCWRRSARPTFRCPRLVERYSLFAASGEINSTVAEVEPILVALEQQFGDRAVADRVDGLTLNGDGWWVNVRPSNTEPLLRLNVEAPTAEQVDALRDEALAIIRA